MRNLWACAVACAVAFAVGGIPALILRGGIELADPVTFIGHSEIVSFVISVVVLYCLTLFTLPSDRSTVHAYAVLVGAFTGLGIWAGDSEFHNLALTVGGQALFVLVASTTVWPAVAGIATSPAAPTSD